MYSFPDLEPVCCSMSSSNCCFLTWIQIPQKTSQVVWYSHLLKNFPQLVVIHTVKGFGIVNKAEIDVFLEVSCFFNDLTDVAIWSLLPLPFLNPAWTTGSSPFTYCWSLAWRILSVTLLVYEMSAIVLKFEHSLALPFFGIGMKTDLFQSCGHCSVFQICWHIECSTFSKNPLDESEREEWKSWLKTQHSVLASAAHIKNSTFRKRRSWHPVPLLHGK